jgi:hypothetical protein
MRITLAIIAAFALGLFSFCEIGLAYPVAWWLYAILALTFGVTIIRPVAARPQLARLVSFAAILGVIAALYFVNWTTRKPFLRDLHRVRPGMAEAEVRQIMGRYMEGTGWPANPFESETNKGSLLIAGSPRRYATTISPSGQMAIRDALVFRHSNDGAFNSDFGIVSFSNGTVVRVEFSPD